MELPEDLQAAYNKLSDKQQRFVDLWTGNPDETAQLAGYSAYHAAGVRALKNVTICHCIKLKRDAELKPLIASRKDRQKFWTDVFNGDVTTKVISKAGEEIELPPKMNDRLKASELLGKSEGDFIERNWVSGPNDDPIEGPKITADMDPKKAAQIYAQMIKNG